MHFVLRSVTISCANFKLKFEKGHVGNVCILALRILQNVGSSAPIQVLGEKSPVSCILDACLYDTHTCLYGARQARRYAADSGSSLCVRHAVTTP